MYDWNPETHISLGTPRVIKRIEKDLKDLIQDPPHGVYLVPDENDLLKSDILIVGPSGTPYEGGMFRFLMACPHDYPFKPPKVKCLTTDGERVSFNPNIYTNGKVCLSILGTWKGPRWTSVMNFTTVSISIQSILNENPYFNEPGYDKERKEGDSQRYNDVIQHETIRVAAVDVYEKRHSYPERLVDKIEATFNQYYDHYVKVCQSNLHLDGREMIDPHSTNGGIFAYATMLEKLQNLKKN